MKRWILYSAFFLATDGFSQTSGTHSIKLLRSISCSPVKDQSMSSTCWSFAANSFLESELLRTKGIELDLSEMFTARYSYIDKARAYLLQEGKIFFTPGGQFHDVIRVVKEYGMVPEVAYSGRPRGIYTHNHAELDTLMKSYVTGLQKKGVRKLGPSHLTYINKLLDKYLGKVPVTFLYNGKYYTPLTFSSQVMQFNANDYIEITSYSHHPWYQKFILEDKYNWMKEYYYNLPLDDLVKIAEHAIWQGYSVCWDGDVTEPGFRFDNGIASFPAPVKDVAAERQKSYENGSTTIDHMMHIIGIAKDENDAIWYQLKNSWGAGNDLGGYLVMSDDYFKIKTVAVIINKNALPPALRQKLAL